MTIVCLSITLRCDASPEISKLLGKATKPMQLDWMALYSSVSDKWTPRPGSAAFRQGRGKSDIHHSVIEKRMGRWFSVNSDGCRTRSTLASELHRSRTTFAFACIRFPVFMAT
jgi:hypothetical protein